MDVTITAISGNNQISSATGNTNGFTLNNHVAFQRLVRRVPVADAVMR